MPKFSDHDLRQMDATWLDAQSKEVLRDIADRALTDLRIARDRLNQNPENSSRPSSSMPPWQRNAVTAALLSQTGERPHDDDERVQDDDESPKAAGAPDEPTPADKPVATNPKADTPDVAARVPAAPKARAGRRIGAKGYGRTQKLMPTLTVPKYPSQCAGCQRPLTPDEKAQGWTGWDTLELQPLAQCGGPAGVLGLQAQVSRHVLMQKTCACGHNTRATATQLPHDPDGWPGVQISEQRLLGPRLSATVVYLCVRMRLPRRKVCELLQELFGLALSSALIDQTVRQTARSVEPLEAQLTQDLEQAALAYADETSWPQGKLALWLWVVCCTHSALYVIGSRAKEMLNNALSASFAGTLMSDGYSVYRERPNRLRC